MVTIEPGSKVVVNSDIENTGTGSGPGQTITLTAEDSTKVTVDTIEDIVVDSGQVQNVTLEWKTAIDESQGIYQLCIETQDSTDCVEADITSVAGNVYYNTLDDFYSLDRYTLDVNWSKNYSGSSYVYPAVSGNQVYSVDGSTMIALDVLTGNEIWTFNAGGQIDSSPAVVDGYVYFASRDGNVYSRDVTDGSENWTYNSGDEFRFSHPAIAGGYLYISDTSSNTLYSIDISDGSENWTLVLNDNAENSITADSNRVYAGNAVNDIVGVTVSGSLDWTYTNSGSGFRGVALSYDKVYAGNGDGEVHAVNKADGSQAWVENVSSQSVAAPPLTAENLVILGDIDANMYALDSDTGTVQWTFTAPDEIGGGASYVGGDIYVGSYAGVHRIDITDGTELEFFSTPDRVLWSGSPGGADGWSVTNRPGATNKEVPKDIF